MNGFMRWLPRIVFLAASIGALLVIVAGPGNRFGLWDFRFALGVLLQYGAYISFAAAAGILIWAVVAAIRRSIEAWRTVLAALVLVAIGAGFPLAFRGQAMSVPPIHDISTDTDDPPAFVAVLPLRAGAMNPPEYAGPETAAKQKEAYPDIQPIMSDESPQAMFDKALAAAKDMGWEIDAAAPEEGRIEATDTTMWFGFKDDVVIRVRAEGAGSRLDIRSKSRVGISDVGKNAERIRAFMDKMG